MKKYSGIDLHSNNSVVVVADEDDRIIYQKRLANKLDEILMALAPHKEEIIGVVVESTYNWYWLVDGLMDAGYQVHLANPSAIKKYDGLKYSGDFADAAYLAICCAWDCCPRATSSRGSYVQYATWHASGCSWCIIGRRRSYPSRIS
jgi:hypothetical protein